MNKQTRNLINLGALKCCICGLVIESPKDYSVEHEPPRSRQKELGKSNTYHSHKKCNSDKGALTMQEYALYCELRAKKNGLIR